MKINVRFCGNAPNLRKRLHGTQLVVGLHHRNQHSFFADGPPHVVKGNQAIAVDRQITDPCATPKIAWLSASVPPLVKTISCGRAPISAATCSRAVSTAARALCPKVWIEAAFPNSPERYGSIAWRTSGSTGVVAL